MARGAQGNGADPMMQPGFELRVCVICAMPAAFKLDSKQRPYVYCPS